MAPSFRRPRPTPLLIVITLIILTVLYTISKHQYQLKNLLSYSTRPLWDSNSGPQEVITHFYGDGLKIDEHICDIHGWSTRPSTESVKVLDAVLMSNELDLLEIRMHELDSVVDYFLILESNATFTGLPKETFFANNRARFSKFEDKIVYNFLPGAALRPGQSPWDVEAHTRNTMTMLIRSHLSTTGLQNTPNMVIMSDLDEIPARHTVDLLKSCEFGQSIHLQLRDFLYSFEWFIGFTSWRASVHMWNDNSYYRHSKSGERILADAGWHCSYCFRTIPEYAIKMKGFSHADRIAGRVNLLDPKRIQDTICRGKDIFGMLPEAYSYVDLLSQMSLKPGKSAVGLPRYLIEKSENFRFLLPGGCIREQGSPS
ncbi:Beta-1,4-mannosyl-glycoprotein 4-beta-N-acetylglucosaminyltransferase [Psilocybe cubensis]|uniref:Glycosyltransferase family 17 protein n=2 Tax=Psilocybe cubensis TaxID=181762 RepID=A0A8H7Y7A0_PSICU|nr:Beta-1,4-mannosyl-glycoprotein 4-beta-N-acetylglucosaminyltransferase [Psilocybe cubensis]KAH9485041.1 Beta-1,4-mannosyl-glycoprotein 4-beta-N-acetylglucosaminyltransferase [Psilocybe cubensis]